eukprot:Nk52_evm84s914 gene=Nk52_evmTU84s914
MITTPDKLPGGVQGGEACIGGINEEQSENKKVSFNMSTSPFSEGNFSPRPRGLNSPNGGAYGASLKRRGIREGEYSSPGTSHQRHEAYVSTTMRSPRGIQQWEDESVKEVFGPNNRKRLITGSERIWAFCFALFNFACFSLLFLMSQSPTMWELQPLAFSYGIPTSTLYYVSMLLMCLFLIGLLFDLKKALTPSSLFTDMDLTAKQRKLIGLPPCKRSNAFKKQKFESGFAKEVYKNGSGRYLSANTSPSVESYRSPDVKSSIRASGVGLHSPFQNNAYESEGDVRGHGYNDSPELRLEGPSSNMFRLRNQKTVNSPSRFGDSPSFANSGLNGSISSHLENSFLSNEASPGLGGQSSSRHSYSRSVPQYRTPPALAGFEKINSPAALAKYLEESGTRYPASGETLASQENVQSGVGNSLSVGPQSRNSTPRRSSVSPNLHSLQQTQFQSPPGSANSANTMMSYPYLQKYRVASRPFETPLNKSHARMDDKLGLLNTQLSEEILMKLNIEKYMNKWTENCRIWLSQNILQRLVADIESVDAALSNAGISHLCMKEMFSGAYKLGNTSQMDPRLTGNSTLQRTNTVFPGGGMFQQPTNASQMTLSEAASRFPNEEIIRKRVVLGQYVEGVQGCSTPQQREYVYRRILELAETTCLPGYRWNGGGKFKGKEWNSDLPTDFQIVIHLFTTYMDLLLPEDTRGLKGRPFSSLHYVVSPDSAETGKIDAEVVIFQSEIYPPKVKIVTKEESWEILQGRNNLFHAIILFLFYVKKRMSGHIGHRPIFLNSPGVELLSVINED